MAASFDGHADSAVAGKWEQYGNGPGHTNYYPKTIGSGSFTLDWEAPVGLQAPWVTVVGDTVYGTGAGELFALDVTTGAKRWKFPTGNADCSPVAYANGRLYFQRVGVRADMLLLCVDAASGRLLWAKPQESQWANYEAPTVAEGKVFTGGGEYGGMYFHDATTGEPLFFQALDVRDSWTPTYADGSVYTCVHRVLRARDPATGVERWAANVAPDYYDSFENIYTIPAVAGGVAAISEVGRLILMDLATHTVRWSVSNFPQSQPVLTPETVFAVVGTSVKAYNVQTGALRGSYNPANVYSVERPLVTKDLVFVPTGDGIFIFDRANYTLRQKLNRKGAISYAAGALYVSGAIDWNKSGVTKYKVSPQEADPAPPPLPPPAGLQPRANPSRTLAAAATPWLQATRRNGVAYFLFGAPAKIERYDLSTGAWLAPISLPDGPTAFAVSDVRIYVAFGNRLSFFSLDGATETPLVNSLYSIGSIFPGNSQLCLLDPLRTTVTMLDALTGATLDVRALDYPINGAVFAKAESRLVGVTSGTPTEPRGLDVHSDGTLGGPVDGPGYNIGITRVALFPRDARFIASNGKIFATDRLDQIGDLGEGFDDIDFAGEAPVILKGHELIVRSPTLEEAGRLTLAGTPTRVFVGGTNAITFSVEPGRGVAAATTSLANLLAKVDTVPFIPTALHYQPDVIEFDGTDTVYLLSRLHQSVFRWSVSQRRYLSTFSLPDVPQSMTFSAASQRLYLGHRDGRIKMIDLLHPPTETGFVRAPDGAGQIVAAGAFLVVDPSLSGARRVYDAAGTVRSLRQDDYNARELIWNNPTRRLYYASDDWSLVGPIVETINSNGVIGAPSQPFRFDESIQHPIRVAPDGSVVLTGDGSFFEGATLDPAGSLGTKVSDAVWLNGNLVTVTGIVPFLGDTPTMGKLQAWDQTRHVTGSQAVEGQPLRMFALQNGLLLMTRVEGEVRFETHSADLAQLTSDPGDHPPPTQLVPHPNPPRVLADTNSPWRDAASANGIAYFLFDNPAKIERYDLTQKDWLDAIPLPAAPKTFAVSGQGIFVSFGKKVSIFSLDGTTETPLFTAGADLLQLFAGAETLYAAGNYPDRAVAIDLETGANRGEIAFGFADYVTNLCFCPATARLFGIEWFVPSSLFGVTLGPDGAVGPPKVVRFDYYAPDYPPRFFFSPNGSRVAASDGAIYDPDSLTSTGKQIRPFADLSYLGDEPIVLRDQTLIRYTAAFAERSWYLLPGDAQRIFAHGRTVVAFTQENGRGVAATAVPLTAFHGGAIGGKPRGTFSGWFDDGLITVTMLTNGTLSGVVRRPGATAPFRMALDYQNTATGTVSVGGMKLRLDLFLIEDSQGPRFRVDVTRMPDDAYFGSFTAPLVPVLKAKEASAFTGAYTWVLSDTDSHFDASVPPVAGYGRIVVGRTGSAKLTGVLADGTRVSSGGAVNTAGQFMLFVSSAPKGPSLIGEIDFADLANADGVGTAWWIKPAKPRAPYYPDFISHDLEFVASRYVPGKPVLDVEPTTEQANAAICFLGGNLVTAVREGVALLENNTVTLAPKGVPHLLGSLRVDAKTGLVTGAVHKPRNAKGPLGGVIFQKSNAVFGWFVGVGQYGAFRVDAFGDHAAPAASASPSNVFKVLFDAASSLPLPAVTGSN